MRALPGILLFSLLLTLPTSAQLLRPVVGEDVIYIAQGEKESLLEIAERHGIAIDHLALANGYPDTATHVLGGTRMLLPKKRILPANPPATGLVLNIPERGLYRFDKGKFVEFIPVAVGPKDSKTPTGSFYIIEKVKDPTWYPPKWNGDTTPVGPGPKNPLGDRWIGLSSPRVGIHGTNNPLNVGNTVTHGCIRCYPKSIHKLYEQVHTGMPVRIEYETAKLGKDSAGNLYLANFPDIYERSDPLERSANLLRKLGAPALLEDPNFSARMNLIMGLALTLEKTPPPKPEEIEEPIAESVGDPPQPESPEPDPQASPTEKPSGSTDSPEASSEPTGEVKAPVQKVEAPTSRPSDEQPESDGNAADE